MLFNTRMIWKSVHLVELEKEQNFKSIAVCLNIVVKAKKKHCRATTCIINIECLCSNLVWKPIFKALSKFNHGELYYLQEQEHSVTRALGEQSSYSSLRQHGLFGICQSYCRKLVLSPIRHPSAVQYLKRTDLCGYAILVPFTDFRYGSVRIYVRPVPYNRTLSQVRIYCIIYNDYIGGIIYLSFSALCA